MIEIDQLFTTVENYDEMTIEQLQVCINEFQLSYPTFCTPDLRTLTLVPITSINALINVHSSRRLERSCNISLPFPKRKFPEIPNSDSEQEPYMLQDLNTAASLVQYVLYIPRFNNVLRID